MGALQSLKLNKIHVHSEIGKIAWVRAISSNITVLRQSEIVAFRSFCIANHRCMQL